MTKFIEITQGLKEGDRGLLSPPFDTQEKELDGAVLAADEKARRRPNRPHRQAVAFGHTGRGAGRTVAVNAPGPGGDDNAARGERSVRRGAFNFNGDGEAVR